MKLNVKISLLIFILLMINCFSAYAQHPKKRLTADFRMGVNYVTMSGRESAPPNNGDPGDYTSDAGAQFKIGMHVGGNVNYKLIGNFQMQIGFYVTKKGYKNYVWDQTKSTSSGVSILNERWYEATANYIQMPFNVGYEWYFNKDMAFNINGGVYVAYGYGNKGRIKYHGRSTTMDSDGQVTVNDLSGAYEEHTFSDTRWRRPDYGLNGSIGFIYDIYTLNLNYEHGLYNVTRDPNNPKEHRVYSLSLGFRF